MTTMPILDAADALLRAGPQRLRILVAAAAPLLEQEPLDLEREWRLLRQNLEDGAVPAALVRLLPCTRETLVRTLDRAAAARVPAQVLHFAGHGEPDHLLFETPLGEPYRYGGDALARDLRARGVRLVFLNACKTASTTPLSLARDLIASGAIDAAIGHEKPVGDEAAILFSSRLYGGLCQGARLRDAFEAAKAALAARFPHTAGRTRLFGDGGLHFGEAGADAPRTAFFFNGTFGRGRIPEMARCFGRSKELVTIGRFFEATGKRALALSGIGGLGKTSLALESASRHAWRFPGGIAFSSGRALARGNPTAESLLQPMLAALELPSVPLERAVERLFGYLREHPGLLVFDDLDEVPPSELERLVRILEQLPLNGSKALLALRTAPQFLRERSWIQPITLTTGLSPSAGAAYVVHAARGKVPDLANTSPNSDLPRHLAQALAGHPKLLDIAVNIAATRGLAALKEAVPELSRFDCAAPLGPVTQMIGARLETLLEQASRLLDTDGRWVLSFFPYSPDGTLTWEELHAAARGAERAASRIVPPVARIISGLSACVEAGLVEYEPRTALYRAHFTVQWHISRREPHHGIDSLLELIEHGLAYVAAHLHDHAAIDRRLAFLMSVFDQAWHAKVPEALRQPVLAAMSQMLPFLIDHAIQLPNLPLWLKRFEERRGETLAERARRLYRQSILLMGKGKPTEAKQCARESIGLCRKLGLLADLAAALEQCAQAEVLLGNIQEARNLVGECLELLRTIDNPIIEVNALNVLAFIKLREGHYQEARIHVLKALDKQKETDTPPGRDLAGALWMLLGVITCSLGNLTEGNRFFEKGSALIKATGNPLGNMLILPWLAQGKADRGLFMEARAILAQSMETPGTTESPYVRAMLLLIRALGERQQGQYDEAVQSLTQALEFYGETACHNERAMILNELVGIYLIQGRDSIARKWLDQSLKLQEQVGDDVIRALSLNYQAALEFREGHYEKARHSAEASLALHTSIGHGVGRANILHQLGAIEGRLGHYTKAEEYLRESVRLMDPLENPQNRAQALSVLAQILARQGQREEAREHLQEAITLLEGTGSSYLPIARRILLNLDAPPAQGGTSTPSYAPSIDRLMSLTERRISTGHPEAALKDIRAERANPKWANDPRKLAALHAYEAQVLAIAARKHEALESLRKALALAEAGGSAEQVNELRGLQKDIERMPG
ncbi:tetratricopeptide repeat protein [Archangium violaceum]|uniref:tetratricopeptide repeat protein n=1 Tax=Archangium violaceum TaxID=83451 RepID=UPI002B306AD4|nr:tetratricopeptide repeat protein [Archangium gephyra]